MYIQLLENLVSMKNDIPFPSKLAISLNYESREVALCSISIFGFVVIRGLNHITKRYIACM
jgi:hypothetical protein